MTSILSRDEMHERVDAVHDAIEEATDEEAVAIIGGLVGDMNVHAPSDSKEYFRIRGTVGYGDFTFNGAWELGQAARQNTKNSLLGTLVVPRSDVLEQTARAALDGDEEAIKALTGSDE